MTSSDYAQLYDANYYETGCGRPYQRDEVWLATFDRIAKKIQQHIAPTSVLDAGCAMGFLVEQLRQRDIEAFGVDISEYGITNVHPSIAPYCWVGSVAAPFPQKYDLIVTIEVLEHMPKEEALAAIANFCQHSDDIIFSSTPLDFKEVTHFNVQQPEYWAQQFALHGFYRDVDFDASFITPWATRFRRRSEPQHRLISDYERRYWLLHKENQDLRQLVMDMRNESHQTEQTLTSQLDLAQAQQQHLKAEILSLKTDTHNLKRDVRLINTEKNRLHTLWQAHRTSIGWVVLEKLQHFRAAVSPPGSRRDNFFNEVFGEIRTRRLGGALTHFARNSKTYLSQMVNALRPAGAAKPNTYHDWFMAHQPTAEALDQQRATAQQFAYRPVISFITPVYNPTPTVLREVLESVLAQTYNQWQLCLANASDQNPDVDALLDHYAQKDPRIIVRHLPENHGISANSNTALALATGDFIAILDHDDKVAPNMLFEVVSLLNQHQSADVIYFDEDKLAADKDEHIEPLFKSTWSRYQLWGANNMMHSVFRHSLVKDTGGFDSEMDGAQDWDLALRCAEQTDQFYHIPKILYHWRKFPGSASGDAQAKPWAIQAQAQCITAHLERQGLSDITLSRPRPEVVHLTWTHATPKVSIIIPTKNNAELLLACVTTILNRTDYPDYEIIIINNDSYQPKAQHYLTLLKEAACVTVLDYNHPFDYGAINNHGAQHASGEVLLFLHNDTEIIDPTWLHEAVQWLERPDIGLVGAKLINTDGSIQHGGVIVGLQGSHSYLFSRSAEYQYHIFGSPEWYREYTAVSGVCCALTRHLFTQLNGFTPNLSLDDSPLDLCLRVREAGYRVFYNPFIRILHQRHSSRQYLPDTTPPTLSTPTLNTLQQQGDPYFNPNLSYHYSLPTLTNE